MPAELMALKTTYGDLLKKYANFHVPAYQVKVGETDISVDAGIVIDGLRVDVPLYDSAGSASFSIVNAYKPKENDFDGAVLEKIKLGSNVEVMLGYGSSLTCVFRGFVAAIGAQFGPSGDPTLSVTCMDVRRMMMEQQFNKSKKNVTNYSLEAKAVLSNEHYACVLPASYIVCDTSQNLNSALIQREEKDYSYVSRLASSINFEFFVVQGYAYFRPQRKEPAPIMTLSWGAELISFSRELGLRGYVAEIQVSGKVQNGKERAFYKLERPSDPSVKPGVGTVKSIVDDSLETNDACRLRAEAELEKLKRDAIVGQCECIGLPEICPGRFIDLQGLSARFNGHYYITGVQHQMGSGGYTTSFSVGVNE